MKTLSDLLKKTSDSTVILAYLLTLGSATALLVAWATPNHRALGVLLWLTFVLLGTVAGFLFGIPRTRQGDTATAATAATATDGTAVPATGSGSDAPRIAYSISANTNLEQVSDWLTKIIVGVGLVELKNIPAAIGRLAEYLSSPFALVSAAAPGRGTNRLTPDFAVVFTLATILTAFWLGFLGGYLLTRMFLTGAFARADQLAQRRTEDTQTIIQVAVQAQGPVPALDARTLVAATALRNRSFDDFHDATEVAAWAKIRLTDARFDDAVRGYTRAVAMAPENPQFHQEFAVALYRAHPNDEGTRREIIGELEKARARIEPTTPADLRRRIYIDLTYHYLYLPPIEGFTKAFATAEDYVRAPPNMPSSGVWINLACACGQKYAWAAQQGNEEERTMTRERALEAVRAAIALRPESAGIVRRLMGCDPQDTTGDRDLQVFANVPEFLRAAGLPIPTANGNVP